MAIDLLFIIHCYLLIDILYKKPLTIKNDSEGFLALMALIVLLFHQGHHNH